MNRYAPLLVGLALLGSTGSALAVVPGESAPRTVTVSGNGEVRAAPDEATVTLGVSARSPTVEEARARINKVVPTLLKLARDLKVADSNVRSTELAVNPEYGWDAKHTLRRLTGYRLERWLVVELKDVERLGELLEKSVSLGANIVNEPQLDSTRRADLEREALALASADAKRNAEVLATAAGGAVGPPRELAMTGTSMPRERMLLANSFAAAPAEAAATYRVGELTFGAGVQATFDLLPGGAAAR